MTRKLGWAWIAALVAVVCYFAWTWGDLPDRVATHFDTEGKPNGFMGKGDYLNFFLRFVLMMNVLFGVVYFFTAKIPTQLLNIPWRNYWLANEVQKSQLFDRLKGLACLLGLFVNTVHLLTAHIIYQENTPHPFLRLPVTGGVFLILTGVVFLVLYALVILRPPSTPSTAPGKDKSP